MDEAIALFEGNNCVYEAELESRKKTLHDLLSSSQALKFSLGDCVSYVLSRKDADMWNSTCIIDGSAWSTDTKSTAELVDILSKSVAVCVARVSEAADKDLLTLTASTEQKQKIKEYFLSTRLKWNENTDTAEKQRIQKIIGRAREKIRDGGINWVSLRDVVIYNVREDSLVIIPEDNAAFARMCKSASHSWSDTQKRQYTEAMQQIKDSLSPIKGFIPESVYLAIYKDATEPLVLKGSDIIFNITYKNTTPLKSELLGSVYHSKENPHIDYIESTSIYLGPELRKIHKETWSEYMSPYVRQASDEDRIVLDEIEKYQPELIKNLTSKEEIPEIRTIRTAKEEER